MPTSLDDFKNLANSISNGGLILTEFEKLAKITNNSKVSDKTNKNWKNNFDEIMKYAKMSDKAISERLRQFEIYLNMNKIVDISNVLMEIKNKFKLKCSFSLLENLSNSVIILF